MADEKDIAIGIMVLAASDPNNRCSFRRAYQRIPATVSLSASNLAPSLTRPAEQMWQQLVRNIKSHDTNPGNFIAEGYLFHIPSVGYELTPKGRRYLKQNGHI